MTAQSHTGETVEQLASRLVAEVVAETRLADAAPDLLKALKTLLDHDEQDAGCLPTDAHLDAQNDARAAIAKATGEAWT